MLNFIYHGILHCPDEIDIIWEKMWNHVLVGLKLGEICISRSKAKREWSDSITD